MFDRTPITPLDNFPDTNSTAFDLGVDVTGVTLTKAGVAQFLGSLAPDERQVIVATCRHYVANPGAVQSATTVTFCKLVPAN